MIFNINKVQVIDEKNNTVILDNGNKVENLNHKDMKRIVDKYEREGVRVSMIENSIIALGVLVPFLMILIIAKLG